MKNVRKMLSIVMTMIMVLSMMVCGAAETAYTAGVYTGEGAGMNDNIVVEATFSESSITGVKVMSHKETAGIGATSLPKYEEQMNQVLDAAKVDCIAGSTVTYDGFVAAIENAAAKARGEIAIEEEAAEDETMTADVVVVGTGMAGLVAAVSAADAGAEVIMLEKKPGIGTSGHSITAVGTEWTQYEDFGWEELSKYWYDLAEGKVDKDMLDFAAKNSADSIYWLADHGIEFVGATIPPTNPFQNPPMTHVTTANRNGQKAYILPLQKAAEEKGVKIYFNTRAYELIQNDEGAVVGILAENNGRTVTVMADSVVLATGGFGNSSELMAKYCPMVYNTGKDSEGASTGDGLKMAQAVGADCVFPGASMAMYRNPNGAYQDQMGYSMFVNLEGKRFVNESMWQLHRCVEGLKQGYTHIYAIYDSELITAEALEGAIAAGSAFMADSIEELAGKINMDPAVLGATVERYNGFCEAGVDEDFGKPYDRTGLVFDPNREHDYDIDTVEQYYKQLNAIDQGPFFAIYMVADTSNISGTCGGPKIDTDGHVFHTDGHIIPGLFATGELANGQLYGMNYYMSGSQLSFNMTFGRFCGAKAAEEALEK